MAWGSGGGGILAENNLRLVSFGGLSEKSDDKGNAKFV
jgi:hypothetical protein